MVETYEKLIKRILVLNERVWENKVPEGRINEWLANFDGRVADPEVERLHALYWLAQFMYFGSREIRVLLHSLYRDLFFCPMIQELKLNLPVTVTESELSDAIRDELSHTRFLGVGNPSESGIHLLYYFRQENRLSKDSFIDSMKIFTRRDENGNSIRAIRDPNIRRYIFLDDICGSGETARDYSEELLDELLHLNPNAKVAYYTLFAAEAGLKVVREETLFGKNCGAVYELDGSYKCLSDRSRYFNTEGYPEINKDIACQLARVYGDLLDPRYATGYEDSQMLMGFHHNTPDNTLGIIWHDHVTHGQGRSWMPIFKRYPKYLQESA